MKCKEKIPHIALLLFCCLNVVCFGQTITVRLVDVTTQSPVSNQQIYVFGISGKVGTKEEKVRLELSSPSNADLSLVTDSKGVATFDLPEPVPSYFYIRAALSGRHWDCFCAPRVSTEDLEQRGIVVRTLRVKLSHPFSQSRGKSRLPLDQHHGGLDFCGRC